MVPVGACAARWAALAPSERSAVVTEELLRRARCAAHLRDPLALVPLHRLVQVALGLTASQARKAVRRGEIAVDGSVAAGEQVAELGSVVRARVARQLVPRAMGIDERLERWNDGKARWAQIRVLHQEKSWAVVNKPPGLHTSPVGLDLWKNLTFQSYLPALLPPPGTGTPCRGGPRPCHRLDMLVAGPVAVAMSEEAMRSLNHSFQQRLVHKEYRAVVCGHLGDPGASFSMDQDIAGKASHTEASVLRVVADDHYGALSELSLRPLEGRRHQLRIHCASKGVPILNDLTSMYDLAIEQASRHGRALPKQRRRGQGLYLQAVKLQLPNPDNAQPVEVQVDVAEKFDRLLARQKDRGAGALMNACREPRLYSLYRAYGVHVAVEIVAPG